MALHRRSLFIFRRDLRLDDNTALNLALQRSERVLPCFIFDPAQTEPHPYQSQPGLQFMLQSLTKLQRQFQQHSADLAFFAGSPDQVVADLHKQKHIQAVFTNRDYTPFSRHRDQRLAEVCKQLGMAFYSLADGLLTEPEQILNQQQAPYRVFTAFYNKAKQWPVGSPQPLVAHHFLSCRSTTEPNRLALAAHGTFPSGREGALSSLSELHCCQNYQATRDFPALSATSGLSAHLKFGTCSVREAYYAIANQLGAEHPLIRQLYWRDFFTHIAFHYPKVFGQAFLEKYNSLQWQNNEKWFAAWCSGQTGFPIVDAGMRQLNQTGIMHNRLRMIAASFLVKDLHIDWRWGERHFAQKLVDYDPCVNNGNWQWAASTGCDAQPYFRIFNPWLQQKKFDADCQYIYQWLPELKKHPPKLLHQWFKLHQGNDYQAPIVDHNQQTRIIKVHYQSAA